MAFLLILFYVVDICAYNILGSMLGSEMVEWKEKRLIKEMLSAYAKEGTHGRPVAHNNDYLLVNFSLSLIQIMDVDEKNQILKTSIWYHYIWTDSFLTWDPTQHDNITSVRIPSERIWLPDIQLYNFADDRLSERRDALVVVQHTGELLWMPQAMLNSSCSFNTLFFPFDEQECTLKFGSWTYNGFKLDVDFVNGREEMDLSDYTPSNEWDITANRGRKNVKYYICCPEPFPDITFTLRIRRKVAFYTFILILPCGLLSLLTMVIFYVPPESPAKLQLGINIFLAFFLLLLLLADYTPRAAASIPLIGGFFCLSMIMITLSTVLACISANMFFRGVRTNRAPRWLRSCIIDGLARVMCVRDSFLEPRCDVTTPRKTWSTYVSTYRSCSDPETLCAKVSLLEVDNSHMDSKTELHDNELEELLNDMTGEEDAAELLTEVGAIREAMAREQEARGTDDAKMHHIREWHMISCVVDRLFFALYAVVNLIGMLVMLIRWLINE